MPLSPFASLAWNFGEAQPNFALWFDKVQSHKYCNLHNNHLLYWNCTFVNLTFLFIPRILFEYHATPLRGHLALSLKKRINLEYSLEYSTKKMGEILFQCDDSHTMKFLIVLWSLKFLKKWVFIPLQLIPWRNLLLSWDRFPTKLVPRRSFMIPQSSTTLWYHKILHGIMVR